MDRIFYRIFYRANQNLWYTVSAGRVCRARTQLNPSHELPTIAELEATTLPEVSEIGSRENLDPDLQFEDDF